MDAREFARLKIKMCASFDSCVGCDLYEYGCVFAGRNTDEEYNERIIKAVEKWAEKHPEKTRQSEFLKMFPDVKKEEGVVFLYPCDIEKISCSGYSEDKNCNKCREEYWFTPLEEEE